MDRVIPVDRSRTPRSVRRPGRVGVVVGLAVTLALAPGAAPDAELAGLTHLAGLVPTATAAPGPALPLPTPTLPTPTLPVPTLPPVPVPPVTPGTRDPLRQPFSSTSVWNMPIGSGARYVPAGLAAVPGGRAGGTRVPELDEEPLVLSPSAPQVPIRYSAGSFGGDRCRDDPSRVLATVPIPRGYVLPSTGDNQSSAILAADGRTVVNTQPLARCRAGGPATALVRYPDADLYGDGIDGAHGGSGLSALGGSIRVGELRPGQVGPRHALKVNLWAAGELARCRTRPECFRWPARKSDSNAVANYGSKRAGSPIRMGSLLAIPASVDLTRLGLRSGPGRQLAWTLQNYGAYVVDDTYGPAFALNAESGPAGSVRTQFAADWGYDIAATAGDGNPWGADVARIRRALAVVDNNGPLTVGGGGIPRQPLLPPLLPPVR